MRENGAAVDVLSPSPLVATENPEPNPEKVEAPELKIEVAEVVDVVELPNPLKTDAAVVAAFESVLAPKALEAPKGLAVDPPPKENPFESPPPASSVEKFGVADGALMVTVGSSFFSPSLKVKLALSVLLSSGFFSTTRDGSF